MLKFKTRSQARSFASKSIKYKVIDLGVVQGKRWAVKVIF